MECITVPRKKKKNCACVYVFMCFSAQQRATTPTRTKNHSSSRINHKSITTRMFQQSIDNALAQSFTLLNDCILLPICRERFFPCFFRTYSAASHSLRLFWVCWGSVSITWAITPLVHSKYTLAHHTCPYITWGRIFLASCDHASTSAGRRLRKWFQIFGHIGSYNTQPETY